MESSQGTPGAVGLSSLDELDAALHETSNEILAKTSQLLARQRSLLERRRVLLAERRTLLERHRDALACAEALKDEVTQRTRREPGAN